MAINEHQKWPDNKAKFDANYDRIFGKRCPVHRTYRAILPPRCDCSICWEMYNEKHKGK